MRKILSLFLSIILIFSLVTACTTTKTTDKGTEKTSSSDNQDKKDDRIPDYLNTEPFPIVKEKLTLRFMGGKYPLQGPYEDMDVAKALEELTNIHIVFDMVADEAWKEKKNLALASGDLPDAFFRASLTLQDEATYGPQGVFIPLQGLIDKYAPHLKKTMEEFPGVKKGSTALDGNIYIIPYAVKTLTMAGYLMYINTAWLDKLNLKMPINTDEFYNVLKAFKNSNLSKNGPVIPLIARKMGNLNGSLLNAFGDSGGGRFNVINNKVIYTPMTEPYKEYITYVRKLYSEGLIDPELFSHSVEQAYAKVSEERCGVITEDCGGPRQLPVTNEDLHSIIPPMTSHINNKKLTVNIGSGGVLVIPGYFAITSANKYPEATMRWLDILWRKGDEAVNGLSGLSMWIGQEGVHWEYANPEKTQYRLIIKDDKERDPQQYILQKATFGAAGAPARVISDMIMAGGAKTKYDYQMLKAVQSKENYFPYMAQGFPPLARFTDDEQEVIKALENDILTYTEQMEAKFVVGEASMDKWDEFINTLKKMGIEDLIKVRQSAYDRYNKVN